ncbi:MarR family winged helix-turn-helix transcriptional regulator [Kineosporia mesophila]|nr:MarR family winged helix-turn-helix transcriptional regulator [Kineosporia mesophila]MCD5353777.1 MarR family winged helix-turn-helix transcriptional regulator [Kineosporia mesophila]
MMESMDGQTGEQWWDLAYQQRQEEQREERQQRLARQMAAQLAEPKPPPAPEPGPEPEPEPDPLAAQDLTFLLGAAYQSIQTEFRTELDSAGYADVRPLHSLVFQVLQTRGGCTSGDLADDLGLTRQATLQTVKDLEKRGYLRQAPHPEGGRRVLYVLTEKAQQHLRAAGYVLGRIENRLVDKIGDQSLTVLRTRLAQLVRAQVGDDVPPLRPLW